MKILSPFIPGVTTPMILIAFIVVALILTLSLVLNTPSGIKKIEELLINAKLLKDGDFREIIKVVLLVFTFISTMFFILLMYESFGNQQKDKTQTGLSCYAEECTGKAPVADNHCEVGMVTDTTEPVSFPELGEKFKNLNLEIKYSRKCHARWVKLPTVPGATIYFKDTNEKQYQPLRMQDDYPEAQVTGMLSGNITDIRACVSRQGKERKCTGEQR